MTLPAVLADWDLRVLPGPLPHQTLGLGGKHPPEMGQSHGPSQEASLVAGFELERFWVQFAIPSSFHLEAPNPNDRVNHPPTGRLGIYEEHLRAGLCFPIHLFVKIFFDYYKIVLAQLVPNGIRIPIAFVLVCKLLSTAPTCSLF